MRSMDMEIVISNFIQYLEDLQRNDLIRFMEIRDTHPNLYGWIYARQERISQGCSNIDKIFDPCIASVKEDAAARLKVAASKKIFGNAY